MNTNMNVTIRRLANTFIILFLILSGIAAYVQIGNQAFFGGPTLVGGDNVTLSRECPPIDSPLRGRILDRNGNVIAQSVPDSSYRCGYRRQYADWVVSSGLAPLIGYYVLTTNQIGGLEQQYNEQLGGFNQGETLGNDVTRLLHQQRYGNDVYLSIDMNTQIKAAQVYEPSAIHGGQTCQQVNNPPGSIIVEDPNTGQIIAMVSFPTFDPNQLVQLDSRDATVHQAGLNYAKQVFSDTSGSPTLNRAAQGVYTPGSTFKTMTLIAALDAGTYGLNKGFSFDEATKFVVPQGKTVRWEDFFNGTWTGVPGANKFPMSFEDGFAYSDNAMFARAASAVGADTWLSYARKFGILTGSQGTPVPFDAPTQPSRVYPALVNGKPFEFSGDNLADSGFGQGTLQISPLTMAEMTATVATNGFLYEPHVVHKIVPHGQTASGVLPIPDTQAYSGGPVIHPETAQAVRNAFWAVTDHGTAFFSAHPGTGVRLKDTGTFIGGKTGTAQVEDDPHAWWISLAPDDQAPGAPGGAKYIIVVQKEHGNEGACQVFVANDIYLYLNSNPIKSS